MQSESHELPTRCRIKRSGFTIVELLVTLFVIGVLLALIIPAVQRSRESMRRVQCVNNLRQIGLAAAMYEGTHRVFPPGGPSNGSSYGWMVRLLPHLEQAALFDVVVDAASDPTERTPMPDAPTMFQCPSDPAYGQLNMKVASSYAGNSGTGLQEAGFNGMFRHWLPFTAGRDRGGPVAVRDVVDGLSNTALACELLPSFYQSSDVLRLNWDIRPGKVKPQPHQDFVDECRSGEPRYRDNGSPIGVPHRGSLWTWGDSNRTWYNHVLPPGSRSCLKNGNAQYGISSASSVHPGGVNIVFADGHCDFIANTVDVSVWHEFGSRVTQDLDSE